MEVMSDLSSIHDEDLLRKMWQQSEDFGRKKEIRSHLYKLREARLRDFYTGDMESAKNFAKSPLTPSHGESLLDQSFQSFKTKEIRDSESPTRELKYHRGHGGGIVPDTSGWNIQTSSEVSPDGRSSKIETLATTEGVQKLKDGHSEFAGRNEEKSSASHLGDDKNFVKKAAESSSSQLHEKSVTGDGNSERMETRTSKVTSSSSQNVFSSSSSGNQPAALQDNIQSNSKLSEAIRRQQKEIYENRQESFQENRQESRSQNIRRESTIRDEHQQQQNHQQMRSQQCDQLAQTNNENVQESAQLAKTRQMQTADKSSREYQQYVDFLASQKGTVISETVECPKPNVKLITTKKQLEDGTIVTSRRYETQNDAVTQERSQNTSRTHSQTQQKRTDQQEDVFSRLSKARNETDQRFSKTLDDKATQITRETPSTTNPRTDRDQPDHSVYREDRSSGKLTDQTDVFKTNKTVKKDLSQTVRNEKMTTRDFIDSERDRDGPARKATENVYTTRNEDKVREENIKLTHGEYPSAPGQPGSRPSYPASNQSVSSHHSEQHYEHYDQRSTKEVRTSSQDFTTHGFPSVGQETQPRQPTSNRPSEQRPADLPTQDRPTQRPSADYTSPPRNSERPTTSYPVAQSEVPSPRHPGDNSTHGFPSVRSDTPTSGRPNDDYRPASRPTEGPTPENQSTQFSKRPGDRDFTTHGFPSVRPSEDRPGQAQPYDSPRRPSADKPSDFLGTQGFPSVRPHQEQPGSTEPKRTSAVPQQRPVEPHKVPKRPEDFRGTHGFPSVKEDNEVVTTTHRVQKEDNQSIYKSDDASSYTTERTDFRGSTDSLRRDRKVDAAHNAFASSLRCASPVDNRPPSRSTRSSITSIRSSHSPAKRDMRSPSCDSDTSRISSGTFNRSKVTDKRSSITSKSSKKDVFQSNETVDLTTSHIDDNTTAKRRIGVTPKATHPTSDPRRTPTRQSPLDAKKSTPKPTSNKTSESFTGEPNSDHKAVLQNHVPYEEVLTKTKVITDVEAFQGEEVIEEPIVKRDYYKLGIPDAVNSGSINRSPDDKSPRDQRQRSPSPRHEPIVGRSPQPSSEQRPIGTPDRTSKTNIKSKPTKTPDSGKPSNSRPSSTNTTSNSTKFTKTVKVDNAILRDDTKLKTKPTSTFRKPTSDDEGYEPDERGTLRRKPESTSDDEGFEQDSPKSTSPYGLKKVPTTDLDEDNVLIEIHESHVDSNVTTDVMDFATEDTENVDIVKKRSPQPKSYKPDEPSEDEDNVRRYPKPSAPQYEEPESEPRNINRDGRPKPEVSSHTPYDEDYLSERTVINRIDKHTNIDEDIEETTVHRRPRGPSSPESYPTTSDEATIEDTNPASKYPRKTTRNTAEKVTENIEVNGRSHPRGPFSPDRTHPTQKNTVTTTTDQTTITGISRPRGPSSPERKYPTKEDRSTIDEVEITERIRHTKPRAPSSPERSYPSKNDTRTPIDSTRSPTSPGRKYPSTKHTTTEEEDTTILEVTRQNSPSGPTSPDIKYLTTKDRSVVEEDTEITEVNRRTKPRGPGKPEESYPTAKDTVTTTEHTEIVEDYSSRGPSSPERRYPTSREDEVTEADRRTRPRGPTSPTRTYPLTGDTRTTSKETEVTEISRSSRLSSPDRKYPATKKSTSIEEDTDVTVVNRRSRPRGPTSPERTTSILKDRTTVEEDTEFTEVKRYTRVSPTRAYPATQETVREDIYDKDTKSHRPFYLNEPSPERDDSPKKPGDIKKPRTKPTLTRSETYEDRCRRILGMNDTENIEHTTDVEDFINTEKGTEEVNKVKSRSTSPEKQTPRSTSPEKPSNVRDNKPRSTSPQKNAPTQQNSPRSSSPQKSAPVDKVKSPRNSSPLKPSQRPASPDKRPHEDEKKKPRSNTEYKPRSASPYKPSDFIEIEKSIEELNRTTRRSSSPTKPLTTSNVNDETATISSTRSWYDQDSLHVRSDSHSPSRRSKAPTRETSPKNRNPSRPEYVDHDDVTTIRTSTTYRNKESPYSSPTRKSTPNEGPKGRSPNLSPVRQNKPISPDQSPSRRQSTVTKNTITTTTKVKTIPAEGKEAERPNHITTARIQISPQPSPVASPNRLAGTRPTTRTPISKESTPKSSKPAAPISQTRKPATTTTATITRRTTTDSKTPKVDSEEDFDVVSDSEDVLTVPTPKTPNSTSDQIRPSRKIPVIERKESAPVYRTTKTDKDTQKMSRSTSENYMKTTVTKRTKPDAESPTKSPRKNSAGKISPKTERRPSKCLTTKTINLTTVTNKILNSEDMENVVIDIQQAKSSREPSPNKIVPTPVPLDFDTGKPRYPDVVHEPDDEPKRKPNVQNIPIFEEETNNFVGCHITEVNEDISERSTKLRTNQVVKTQYRIPKIQSPEDNNIPKDDDCLLSVHDKVSKFTTSAEEVKKPKTSAPFQRDLPESEISEDECLLTVDEKVNKFLETAEKVTNEVKTSSSKPIGRPRIEDLDEDIQTDECVLSVSEKVNKFIDKAEKLAPTTPQRSPELVAKIERQISRQSDDIRDDSEVETTTTVRTSVTEKYTPEKPNDRITKKPLPENGTRKNPSATSRQRDILSRPSVWEKKRQPDVNLEDIEVDKHEEEIEETEETYTKRNRSRSRDYDEIKITKKSTKPVKISSMLTDSVSSRKNIFERKTSTDSVRSTTTSKTTKPSDGPRVNVAGPRMTNISSRTPEARRPSNHSPTRRLSEHSTRTTTTTKRISSKYPTEEVDLPTTRRRPSSGRPSDRTHPEDVSPARSNSSYTEEYSSYKSNTQYQGGKRPSFPKEPTTSQPKRGQESVSARRNIFEQGEVSPKPTTGNKPSYMEHTRSSLEHRRDSIEVTKTNYQRKSSVEEEPYEGNPRSSVKFGVELIHKAEPEVRRKSSCPEIPHVEDIFDLQLLEQMLNTVSSYEQRRRIRAQIRVVKKIIDVEKKEKLSTVTKTSTTVTRNQSPSYRTDSPDFARTRSPLVYKPNSSQKFIENESSHVRKNEERVIKERSSSPQSKIQTITTTVTEVRKVGSDKPTKIATSQPKDDKPIWAQRNILKKPSENDKPSRASSSVKKSTATTTRTQQTQRQKVLTDEDCITSSYGIGPTDEDGRPLFGIRALKKKHSQPSETTKVTGSVITEKYYSENGAEPVGERKVTLYSTNPEDLDELETKYDRRESETIKREKSSNDGVTSITKVQKIGKSKVRESPSIMDSKTNSSKQSSKLVRRGSVKEISEKFIRKESSSSVTEKTSSSSYPKAGLILRTKTHTSSRGGTPERYSARSGSADYEDESEQEECDIEIRSSRKHSKVVTESESETESIVHRHVKKSTKSFLNSSGTKVTGVNDVLDRMRNADNVVEDGDTVEDQEARALLNKFLGASVLMSGVEALVPKETKRTNGADNITKEVKTTRVTKTIKTGSGSSSSPVVRKTCAIEEIWDEETLKQLLEQSTSYEERREIRARLKQLMAEREECAEFVASIKAELENEQQTQNQSEKIAIKVEEEEQDDSSGSEYEEIIEEVTDYSEDEEEDCDKNPQNKVEQESEEKKSTVFEEKQTVEIVVEEEHVEVESIVSESVDENTEEEEPQNRTQISEEKQEIKESEIASGKDPIETKEALSSTTTEKTETKEEDGAVVTTTTKVTTRTISAAPKPVSPFAKFKQLDKQNSLQSPKSPLTPTTPGGTSIAPYFKFTDPALNARAATVKEQLLQWCQSKTMEYENVQITNFSTCWTDGLAFCALIHHFLPDTFDYSKLTPQQRRHNFELAFRVADEKAGIAPLLDVEDMVVMKRPDWKCVFTYVQSIFRRFRNCQ